MSLQVLAGTFGRALVDPNSGTYRDRGQKHGKRGKFRRQPSQNVPYKAADVARVGGTGRTGGRTRRAGNYVSGRPFVRLQSTRGPGLERDRRFLQRTSTNAAKRPAGQSRAGQSKAGGKGQRRAL